MLDASTGYMFNMNIFGHFLLIVTYFNDTPCVLMIHTPRLRNFSSFFFLLSSEDIFRKKLWISRIYKFMWRCELEVCYGLIHIFADISYYALNFFWWGDSISRANSLKYYGDIFYASLIFCASISGEIIHYKFQTISHKWTWCINEMSRLIFNIISNNRIFIYFMYFFFVVEVGVGSFLIEKFAESEGLVLFKIDSLIGWPDSLT